MQLSVTSSAFQPNARLPKKHTGEGEDVSPPLSWSGVPASAKELALIMDDPDAPAGTWVHWIIYKIPPTVVGLKEGLAKTAALAEPGGTLQGRNSWDTSGYRGPMPPPGHGTHHYHFKLYALDTTLPVSAVMTSAQLQGAMRGHIVAEGELVGVYSR